MVQAWAWLKSPICLIHSTHKVLICITHKSCRQYTLRMVLAPVLSTNSCSTLCNLHLQQQHSRHFHPILLTCVAQESQLLTSWGRPAVLQILVFLELFNCYSKILCFSARHVWVGRVSWFEGRLNQYNCIQPRLKELKCDFIHKRLWATVMKK